MSRKRRKPPRNDLAHFGAPVAFLAAVTIAVLLIHSGLQHHHATTTVGPIGTTTPSTTTAAGTARRPPGARRFYTVQTGDTFGSIAGKEGMTIEQLQSLNPGVSSNALQVGQKLRIK